MTTVADCAFVTNSSRVLDIFENLPEVCINRAPVNAKELGRGVAMCLSQILLSKQVCKTDISCYITIIASS